MNDTDFEIKPGLGFGHVKFGDTENKLLEVFGNPDRREYLGGQDDLQLGVSLIFERWEIELFVSDSEVYFCSDAIPVAPGMVMVISKSDLTHIRGDYLFRLSRRSVVESCETLRSEVSHSVVEAGILSTKFPSLGLSLHYQEEKLWAVSLEMPFR